MPGGICLELCGALLSVWGMNSPPHHSPHLASFMCPYTPGDIWLCDLDLKKHIKGEAREVI